ncbi:MAG: FAD-dependent oxidoreductase, partial [Gammaproteobacteria bacterium]|nr:FAD-dependent oxidoreductase [Gammaproteobacteria bacterium]
MLQRRLTLLLAVVLSACTGTPGQRHADVIVVGAGIAGLSAALEASANGARVILLDVNSVGGGHAVKAGGFALVDTELQRAKGIEDSPELAFADWAARGDDPSTYWAYRYANESAAEVYDWLTGNDVEFRMVLPTGEDRVPRFHFTRGTAVHAVVPLLRKVLYDTNITIRWNSRVVALARSDGRINGVKVRDERSGKSIQLRSGAVILATGGLQSNLDEVRANWDPSRTPPGRLLRGAGHFATGTGYRLAEWAGADLIAMQKQEIFYNGVPD